MQPDSKQLIRQGAAHHRSGDLKAAKADYLAALEGAPDDADALHLLGQILHAEGDLDTAIAHISRALELVPSLAGADYNLAVVFEQARQPARAETHFKAHIEAHGDDTDALFALARLLHHQGRRRDAEIYYRRLLAVDPTHVGGRINLGACLTELDRPEDAIPELALALEAAPGDAVALNNMAMANQALGRNRAAYDFLDQAYRLEVDNPVIAANLARSGLRLGRYGDSLQVLKSGLDTRRRAGRCVR